MIPILKAAGAPGLTEARRDSTVFMAARTFKPPGKKRFWQPSNKIAGKNMLIPSMIKPMSASVITFSSKSLSSILFRIAVPRSEDGGAEAEAEGGWEQAEAEAEAEGVCGSSLARLGVPCGGDSDSGGGAGPRASAAGVGDGITMAMGSAGMAMGSAAMAMGAAALTMGSADVLSISHPYRDWAVSSSKWLVTKSNISKLSGSNAESSMAW